MTSEERDFRRAFGSAFAVLRGRRGDCPRPDALAQYARGQSGEEEAVRIANHIAACGLCDVLLDRIKSFEAPSTRRTPGSWQAANRGADSHRPGSLQGWWMRIGRVLYHPAAAYTLAIGVIACAALGVLPVRRTETNATPRQDKPAAMAPRVQPIKIIDLDTTRGEPSRVALDPTDNSFVLSFLIPSGSGFRYTASIDGGPPEEIASYDGKGNFSLLCQRDAFAPGKHRLVVSEIDPHTLERHTFQFVFEL